MKIREIKKLLSAKVVSGADLLETDVYSACASDMMSDVLAFVKDQGVLLTGLVNPQVIRTAEMMDMRCVVLVREKKATDEMIKLAELSDIVLMESELRMYDACGNLYTSGLVGTAVN
mgnify:CR=1 FL=1